MNSPLQPSDTHTPVSSYPHVFPSRHGALPLDCLSATPARVSAAQCSRVPGDDPQVIRASTAGGCAAGTVPAGGAEVCARAADAAARRVSITNAAETAPCLHGGM